jgi:hypothetical protein
MAGAARPIFLSSLSSHSYPLSISLLPLFFPLSLSPLDNDELLLELSKHQQFDGWHEASSPSRRSTGAMTATSPVTISSTTHLHGLTRTSSRLPPDPSSVHACRSRPSSSLSRWPLHSFLVSTYWACGWLRQWARGRRWLHHDPAQWWWIQDSRRWIHKMATATQQWIHKIVTALRRW